MRLDWCSQYSGSEPEGPNWAVQAADRSLVRARVDPSNANLCHLGPEVRLSTPSTSIDGHPHQPAVAYKWNRGQYLHGWHDEWPRNRDIYAQCVSKSGQLVGGRFAISAGSGDRIQPAVATGIPSYLMVYEELGPWSPPTSTSSGGCAGRGRRTCCSS